MIKHEVHWPEMGIDNEENADEADEGVKEWMEHPALRKILLTIYLGSELIRIGLFSTIAVGLLLGTASVGFDLSSNTAIVWGFIAAVAVVMGLDELLKRTIEYSIQYGAFLASIVVVISLVRLYLSLKSHRNSIDDPSSLASSLPIESIPILELYKHRNRLL